MKKKMGEICYYCKGENCLSCCVAFIDTKPPTPMPTQFKQKIKGRTNKTIVIEVYRGCVNDVKNLPDGWDYIIDDKDE